MNDYNLSGCIESDHDELCDQPGSFTTNTAVEETEAEAAEYDFNYNTSLYRHRFQQQQQM